MQRTLGAVLALALGLMGSQVPEFTQQYEQRLGGAVAELKTIVARFDQAARKAGLSRAAALETYGQSANAFLSAQGEDMRETLARYQTLSAHLDALKSDGALVRTADLVRYFDPQIAQGTAESYRPGVPVTIEGLAYAGTGLVLGYGVVAGLFGAARRRKRRRQALHDH